MTTAFLLFFWVFFAEWNSEEEKFGVVLLYYGENKQLIE